jgi:two-component system copper resistance phosphate regulon response regulator CusR
MRVLVIEDSERLRRSLRHGLEQLGWEVETASNGEEGLNLLADRDPDAVVLDLMLPGLPGLEVLRRARGQGSRAQVLILSARDRVEDRVRGLESGADDYLVKPFSFDELCARLQAMLRRAHAREENRILCGPVAVDTAAKRAFRDGEPLHLTPSEYAVLELLVLRRGRVTSQEQILDRLYHGTSDVTSNIVEVLVSGLRKKLQGAPDGPGVIQTRRGHGYVVE